MGRSVEMAENGVSKGQLVRAFLPLVLIFGLRKLPIEESQQVVFARGVFLFRLIVTTVVVGLTWWRIRGLPEVEQKKVVKAHEKNLGMGQTEMVPEKTLPIYDRDALLEFTKQQLIQVGIIAVLHLKFELVQPLILSSVLGLIAFPETPVFQVYLLNKSIARPFPYKPPGGLMDMFAGEAAPAASGDSKEDKKKQ